MTSSARLKSFHIAYLFLPPTYRRSRQIPQHADLLANGQPHMFLLEALIL